MIKNSVIVGTKLLYDIPTKIRAVNSVIEDLDKLVFKKDQSKIIANKARKMKIHPSTMRNWIKKYSVPEIREAYINLPSGTLQISNNIIRQDKYATVKKELKNIKKTIDTLKKDMSVQVFNVDSFTY